MLAVYLIKQHTTKWCLTSKNIYRKLSNIFGNIKYVGVDENDLPIVYCFMHLNKEVIKSFLQFITNIMK